MAMKVSELQSAFLQNLQVLLPDWRFISSARHFRKARGPHTWLFHVSCINHANDFHAVGNVAVEYMSGRKRIAVVGASLGNIEGLGQVRHLVSTLKGGIQSAQNLHAQFERVGIPFLERYSSPAAALGALQGGGSEALLVSPLQNLHQEQIQALLALGEPSNNSFKPTPLRGAA